MARAYSARSAYSPRPAVAARAHAQASSTPSTPLQSYSEAARRILTPSADAPSVPAVPAVPHIASQQRIVQKPAAVPVAVQAARQLPIDMELPGDESSWQVQTPFGQSRWYTLRRKASRGMAFALVLLVIFGGMAFSQSYLRLNKVFKGGTETAAALKEDVQPELLKGEGRGRVNILLLGRGGGSHNAPDLTDTIMIASVDPVNKKVSLLSVPRDLWVNVPDKGVMKLNAAFQTGVYGQLGRVVNGSTDPAAIKAGFATIDTTLEEVLGIEIDYNVVVNFNAFKQAVDTVGGITVNVPTDLVDPTMAWENQNDPVLAKAGLQTMDGTRALIYARSRETTSDFARGERQRALLTALKSKVVTVGTLSNPAKLAGLMNAFGDNVQTDLSLSNANRLYGLIKSVSDSGIYSVSLADAQNPYVTTGNMNGQSIVLPKAGLFKYTDIQMYVRSQLKDPYITKENAKIIVLNGTQTPGLASAKADELRGYGYNVVATANTPTAGWLHTTLVDLTHKNKYTKNYLEQRLGQTAATQLSDKTIATNGADFAIIIGSNESSSTQP